jgi:thioredoxin-related protein
MTRKKVMVTELRERCPICNKFKKDVALHIAMKGNVFVTHDPNEPHVKWRREHGLPEGYRTNKEVKEIAELVRKILGAKQKP